MVDYLNRGGMQLALDVPEGYRTVWTMTLTDGTAEYEMPDGFTFDRVVEFQDDTDDTAIGDDVRQLEYLSRQDYQQRVGTDQTLSGTPTSFTYWRKLGSTSTSTVRDYIRFYPVPGADEDGKVIRVYGYKYPDVISAAAMSNVLETPPVYVEAQIMWAAHLAMRDDGDTAMARDFEAQYENQVRKIRNHIVTKSRSRRPKIRPRDSALLPWRDTEVPWPRYLRRP